MELFDASSNLLLLLSLGLLQCARKQHFSRCWPVGALSCLRRF